MLNCVEEYLRIAAGRRASLMNDERNGGTLRVICSVLISDHPYAGRGSMLVDGG